jgi:Uma2 family endonuclease
LFAEQGYIPVMPAIALDPAYRRISVEEFLEMDFGGAKAELEDGLIYMMAGGSEEHARIAGNIFAYLRGALRGSACRPYGSDFATRTDIQTVRLPDVSIYCNNPFAPENNQKKLLGDPQVVFEVLSPSTSSYDQKVKLPEYCALAGVREVILIDPVLERLHLVQRTASGGWNADWLAATDDLTIPSLTLTIPRAEIFARD